MTLTVLYVDDNRSNLSLLRDLFSHVDVDYLEAENAYDGIQTATERQPDVILMDIQMPFLNGIEATRQLKQEEKTAHIPVVMVTADVMPETWHGAKQAGCDGFIAKPISLGGLLLMLNKVTDQRFAESLKPGARH